MKNLKELRTEKGMSQQKLAKRVGTSQQNIHRYEHGSYEPDIESLKQFARVFDTSIDYLVGNTDIRHKIEPVEEYELNDEESSLVDGYRKLSPSARSSVLIMVQTLLEK